MGERGLTRLERLIWSWIEEDYVGEKNAVTQGTILGALRLFYPELKPPKTLRGLKGVMERLKQKRPLLKSIKDGSEYFKQET